MKRKIWISVFCGESYQIDAEIVGYFGINGERGCWCLTHIETGCRVFNPFYTRREATCIARLLSTIPEFGVPFDYKTAVAARRKAIELMGISEYDRHGGIRSRINRADFDRVMRHALVGGQPR